MLNSRLAKKLKHTLRYSMPMLLLVMVVLFQLLDMAVFKLPRERLDGLIYDLKVKRLPPWPASVTNIQIVDIDEFSLANIGRMPWSRDIFAQLTHKLTELGAIVISYDILFSEPQINPAESVLANLDQQIEQEKREKLIKHFDYDQHFVNAVGNTEVVLAVLLHQEQDNTTEQSLRSGAINNSGLSQNQTQTIAAIPEYSAYAGLLPALAKVAAGQGFMNSFEDADGFVRRVALIAEIEGQVYPSLALETFRVYSLIDKVVPVWQNLQNKAYLQGLSIGNTWIATDNQAKIFVPYRGEPRSYPYTSAAAILNNEISDQRFSQAVVFVGTSATGLADLRATPVALGFPGVEIQATVFDALIAPQFIPYQPEWWAEAVLLQLLIIGLLCLLLADRSPLVTSLFALLLVATVLSINLVLWYQFYIYLPLFSALFLTVVLAVFYISSGFFQENKKRRQVKAVFDQYVPPAHIDRILLDPDSVTLAGEKKELSVLFSDIRGFTAISETMTAGELKQWLNQFFSPITHCILQADGTIDKYVGDMVMAFWGAPLDEPQHANKAVAAAFSMLQQLAELNKAYVAQNLPTAHIGIGINTGEMNVGDMGSDFRRSYTVIGDAVNLGSRLEGLTKFYGVDILVSEFTRAQAQDFNYLLIDKVKVKGKVAPVTIYAPLPVNLSKTQQQACIQFNHILRCYFLQQFSQALAELSQLSTDFNNQHLVNLYTQRIQHFLQQAPPADWDGSFIHTTK